MPLLVPRRSTFESADETAIVQYHGAYGIGPAAVTPAAVGLDRETAPSAANAAANAATNAAATMRGRATVAHATPSTLSDAIPTLWAGSAGPCNVTPSAPNRPSRKRRPSSVRRP